MKAIYPSEFLAYATEVLEESHTLRAILREKFLIQHETRPHLGGTKGARLIRQLEDNIRQINQVVEEKKLDLFDDITRILVEYLNSLNLKEPIPTFAEVIECIREVQEPAPSSNLFKLGLQKHTYFGFKLASLAMEYATPEDTHATQSQDIETLLEMLLPKVGIDTKDKSYLQQTVSSIANSIEQQRDGYHAPLLDQNKLILSQIDQVLLRNKTLFFEALAEAMRQKPEEFELQDLEFFQEAEKRGIAKSARHDPFHPRFRRRRKGSLTSAIIRFKHHRPFSTPPPEPAQVIPLHTRKKEHKHRTPKKTPGS